MPNEETPPPPPTLPPPAPRFAPPKITPSRSKRQEELDAIRRRGLTKIFNKHFNTVAAKIQKERAAAEEALAELERRKAELSANPKSYSGGMTLSQFDKLYMELKKRKDDVYRKEKETQELYRRYVRQYTEGENGKHRGMMPSIDEYSPDDIVWQSDLMHAKATDINKATKDSDVGKLTGDFNDLSNPERYGEILISPQPTRRFNTKFQESLQSPDMKTKSTEDPLAALVSPAPTSVSSSDNSSGENDSVRDDPQDYISPTESDHISPTKSDNEKSYNSDSLIGMITTQMNSDNLIDNSDEESTMSGLTTIDGATVVEAEWRLANFLRVETENIRKMLAEEEERANADGQSIGSQPSIIVGEVSQAANEAEEMAKQMQAASAWMNDPNLLDSDSEDETDEKESAARNAVWRCYWSEEHKREYYHNTETDQTCWTKPQGEQIDFSTCKRTSSQQNHDKKDDKDVETQSVITSTLENDADSVTVKDYTKSRKVVIVDPSEYTNEEMIDVFRPDNSDAMSISSRSSTKQSSKVLEYRRKRARARKMKRRKRMTFVFIVLSSIAYFVYRSKSPVNGGSEDVTMDQNTSEDVVPFEGIENSYGDSNADAQKYDQVQLIVEDSVDSKILDSDKAVSVDVIDDETVFVDNQIAVHRPWACGIPFAYIPSKKCAILASELPLYDCQALTDTMME